MDWTNGMAITADYLNDLEERVANKYSSSIVNFSVKQNNFTPEDLSQACENNKLILIDGMFLYECIKSSMNIRITFGSFSNSYLYIYNYYNNQWVLNSSNNGGGLQPK